MNIYEEKLIIVGGLKLWEGWRQAAEGGYQTSSPSRTILQDFLSRSNPSCPSAPDHRAEGGFEQIRSSGPHPTPTPNLVAATLPF